jgi:hypothetical protein
MMILIRDAAVKYHPVIGIAALSSPAVQIRIRDEWLGWLPEAFLRQTREKSTPKIAKWLCRITDQATEEIYKDDLLEDTILAVEQLRSPSKEVISSLEREAASQREKHHRLMEAGNYKKTETAKKPTAEHWEEQARSPLFRSKRAETLARLLWARFVLQRFFDDKPTQEKLGELLKNPEGCQAVAAIVRKAKADRVGVALADISVCGALPPYNEILGGKLVSMILTSPEVIRAYHDRYATATSIIASSMAGRPIVRPPHLVCFSTTSLYGGGSSQYNRIVIPCEKIGGQPDEQICYVRLGETIGFGTGQFGLSTVQELTKLVEQSENGQRVNSIFGEGVNPRLRKVRNGLNELGFSSDHLLVHGSPRLVYGIPLARNFREYLLGIDEKPAYYLPAKDPRAITTQIVHWWAERWLAPRIQKDEFLTRVAQHTLVHPIRHGARIPFVQEDLDQLSPFNETDYFGQK